MGLSPLVPSAFRLSCAERTVCVYLSDTHMKVITISEVLWDVLRENNVPAYRITIADTTAAMVASKPGAVPEQTLVEALAL